LIALAPGSRKRADRGFGDHKLFAYLADLGFADVVRFRGNLHVTDASGETRTAANWELGWPIGTGAQAARRPRCPRYHVERLSGRRGGVCTHVT
jgi:hypothetical protein